MLMNDLIYKTAKKRLLFAAKVSLTPNCNLSCRHCYLGPPQGETLKTEEFQEVISQLARLGCLYLTLTGGEPTVYPGFWEIISFARKQGFYIQLFTNGTLLDQEAVLRLVRYGVNEIYVSLYGNKPDVHDLITGVAGSFEKTVNAITCLKKLGLKVFVKSSIITLNKHLPLEIEDFCRKLGVACNISYILSPRTDGNDETLLLQYPDGIEAIRFSGLPPRSAQKSYGSAAIRCLAAENSCFIEYDGTLYPCVNYRYPCGNIKNTPLEEIWSSREMAQVRDGKMIPEECRNCSAINNCLRCPGLSYYESRVKNGFSRIQCQQTEILQNLKERGVKSACESLCKTCNNS